MDCLNCHYRGLIDQYCPGCGIDIYGEKYVALARERGMFGGEA